MSRVPLDIRALCFERDRYACVRCSVTSPDLQLHHRRARGMGSTRRPETNQPANLIVLCLRGHQDVERNREAARDAGWLLRQQQDPATVPVLWHGQRVLLDNAGGVMAVAA